ncbi:hypothetical protein ABIA03_004693 [Bradyrhizobium yuanmingense]
MAVKAAAAPIFFDTPLVSILLVDPQIGLCAR